MREELISQNFQFEPPICKWIIAIISLFIISLCLGTPNIYPSVDKEMKELLGVSNNVCTFMLTAGTFLMYFTLPAGLIADKFGSTIPFVISVLLTLISYISMAFSSSISWLFIILYLLGAFGSSSTFLLCLEIVIARSPKSIPTISVSIVSAALSLSTGTWIQIYNLGGKLFKCTENCTLIKIKTVILFLSISLLLFSLIALFFFRQFREHKDSNSVDFSSQSINYWMVLKNPRLYLLMITIFLTVFDGLTILNGGPKLWEIYGSKDEKEQITYVTVFSIVNCVMTILISFLIDFLIAKFKFSRIRIFSCIWMIFIIIHILIVILFNFSHSTIAFGIATSLMGIPFGVGLANIPAITAELFGNSNYGFAFGIIQIGSMIAAGITMPIENHVSKLGFTIILIVQIVLHILTSIFLFISKKEKIHSDFSSFPTIT